MLNRIRDRFGTAGLVVSIMALVLALAGGAFAASGGLNAKQKKQVKAIAKTFAGKPGSTGPAGPAGPAGANGAKGDTGAAGANGTNGTNGTNGAAGTNGKTVLSGFGAPGGLVGTNGDFYIDTDSQTIYGPKGDVTPGEWPTPGTSLKGPPGTFSTEPLPTGETLTGVWGVAASSAAMTSEGAPAPRVRTVISFPIPLTSAPGIHVPGDPDFGDFCTGSAATPTAPSGELCVYVGEADADAFPFKTGSPVSAHGVVLNVLSIGASAATSGTWAVTG